MNAINTIRTDAVFSTNSLADYDNLQLDFSAVANEIEEIAKTEDTRLITEKNKSDVCRIDGFSNYGFQSFGRTIGFPARFINQLIKSNEELALQVVKDRVNNYFDEGKNPFFIRNFLGKTVGTVSNKYAYFDDKQVVEILENTDLSHLKIQKAFITPERLHIRIIDDNLPFRVMGDDSDLFFAYNVDNSMVGQSAFTVRIGIYRLICNNGMALPVREFSLCRKVHYGMKATAETFQSGLERLNKNRKDMQRLITVMAESEASIESLKENHQKDYVQKRLRISDKGAEKILELYHTTYENLGKTKWSFANAVTEYARDLTDIDEQQRLEQLAYVIA